MGLDRFKWWQWVLLALIVGPLAGWLYSSYDAPVARTASMQNLMQAMWRPDHPEHGPWVNNLTILPPGERTVLMTYSLLTIDADNSPRRETWRIVTPVPFMPPQRGWNRIDLGGIERPTVKDYFDAMNKARAGNPNLRQIEYTYAWWAEPTTAMGMATAGSVVVLGVLCPLAVGAATGTLGRRKQDDAEEDRSASWGKGAPEPERAPAKSGPTPEEEARLAEMNARLESGLGGARVDPAARGLSGAQGDTAPAIRKLDGKPLDDPKPAETDKPKEDVEYVGEFYPTARVKKKDE